MAGRIPQPFIDEVVARSDIVELIGARVSLRKAGREFKACCPFHDEKTPSFSVSPDKQFFHCFGCGAHGTAIGFLMQFEKLGFIDAVADLAQRAGLPLPVEAHPVHDSAGTDLYDLMGRATRFFEQTLADEARGQAYLRARSIDAATCANFALGFAPDSWNAVVTRFGPDADSRGQLLQAGLIIERDDRGGERAAGFYDRFRDRLMFPIRDLRGRTLAFGGRIIDQGEPKYLNSPETALFHKGRELYGLYEARRARADFSSLLIVEGYMDVVRLHQAGFTQAVATLGTATTQEHLNRLFRLTQELVFCFDGDRAGRQAAWRALENALPMAQDGRELKFMFLPDGEDPDSLLKKEGGSAFQARMQEALPLSEYLLKQLVQQVDLTHLDGRARLKALAQPLFVRLPEGVYRELLADRLAREIGMPVGKLKELLWAGFAGKERTARQAPMPRRRDRMSGGRGNLLTQAIILALHYPAAAAAIGDPEILDGVDRPGVSVLKELLQQATGGTGAGAPTAHVAAAGAPSVGVPASTAVLLERWRDRPEYDRLCELAVQDPLVPDEAAAAAELRMAVEKLIEEFGPKRRVDELLRKAEDLGLNYAEKAELSTLLSTKGRLRAPP